MSAEVRVLLKECAQGTGNRGQVFDEELYGRRYGGMVAGSPDPRLMVGTFRHAYSDVSGSFHGFPARCVEGRPEVFRDSDINCAPNE